MTHATYQRGKAPWTVQCDPKCESDNNGKQRRREIKAAWYKMHKGQTTGIDFEDKTTWPPLSQFKCHRCGQNHSGQAKAETVQVKAVQVAQVETAPQAGQAFDAMQDARDNMRANGMFSSGYSTQLASKIADAIGCSFGDARPRASRVCDAVKSEFKRAKQYGTPFNSSKAQAKTVETKEDKAGMTQEFIGRISAPKAQAKPAPKAEGSVEVMSVELFAELSKHTPIKMKEVTTTIVVETITVNGTVFRCS